MSKNHSQTSILGLVILLAMAFALDRGIDTLRAYAGRSFNAVPAIMVAIFGTLLLVICGIALLRYAIFGNEHSGLVAIVYLILGSPIVLGSLIWILPGVYIPAPFGYLFLYLSSDTRLFLTASMMTAGGLTGFLQRKK